MELPPWLENALERGCVFFFRHWPQPFPEAQLLRECQIIAHRGAPAPPAVLENTHAAFERALSHPGVNGLEFDVRWTQDLQPVVSHDADLFRLYGDSRCIVDFTLAELQYAFPEIPTLAAVIERYRARAHLMVELKEEPYPDLERQNRIFSEHFAALTPKEDFHILGLSSEFLRETVTFVERDACLLVAVFNEKELSAAALSGGFAGLAGHYLLVTHQLVRQHLAAGQMIGVGYPDSRNCLFRELNRGVTQLFSNDPLGLAELREQALQEAGSKA